MNFDSTKNLLRSIQTKLYQIYQKTNVRRISCHGIVATVEIGLLLIQYVRMSAVAYDQLPEVSDIQISSIYGNNIVGAIWVLMIVGVTYATVEALLRVYQSRKNPNPLMTGIAVFLVLLNIGMCVFEYALFHTMIHDLGDQGTAVPTWLLGILMLAFHQVCAFWIMHNLIKSLFFEATKKEA